MPAANFNGYLIGIKDNQHPCGNDGTCRNHYKLSGPLHLRAERMKTAGKLDEVWLIHTYSQRMCEMDPDVFVDHVRKIGTRIV